MPTKVNITHDDVVFQSFRLVETLAPFLSNKWNQDIRVFGIPRGGIAPAYLILGQLLQLRYRAAMTHDPKCADIIVDDIVDSGRTRDHYQELNPKAHFLSFFEARKDAWLVFPWEQGEEGQDDQSATDIPIRLLQFIGEDVTRSGLKETPARFIGAWQEWTEGYALSEDAIAIMLKAFSDGADGVDEMVLVKDIPLYSHCEHHLAPFFGKAHVAYIPRGQILGLSKIPRLVEVYSKRLQVQERLTQQIANALVKHLKPTGVAVVLECRHMCMESRGVQVPGTTTTTSCLLGAFKDNQAARAEFMRLVR